MWNQGNNADAIVAIDLFLIIRSAYQSRLVHVPIFIISVLHSSLAIFMIFVLRCFWWNCFYLNKILALLPVPSQVNVVLLGYPTPCPHVYLRRNSITFPSFNQIVWWGTRMSTYLLIFHCFPQAGWLLRG